MTSLNTGQSSSGQSVTEYVVRVPRNPSKRYNLMAFNAADKVDFSTWNQCPDGAFEAFPVSNWYNFTPLAKHRTLTAEEAEQEWERRNKILNHLSIVQQRRLKDQGGEDEDEDEEEGAAKQDKGGKKKNDLKIDDIDEEPDHSSESGEEGERGVKPQKKPAAQSKMQESDNEALEDSDDGDFEGQEVDYVFESR